jgi:hypothetical protein
MPGHDVYQVRPAAKATTEGFVLKTEQGQLMVNVTPGPGLEVKNTFGSGDIENNKTSRE